jgi:hypothetical protein
MAGMGFRVVYLNDTSHSTYTAYPYPSDVPFDAGTTDEPYFYGNETIELFYNVETQTEDAFEEYKRQIAEYEKSLARWLYIRHLAKLSRAPMLPHVFFLVFIPPLLCRKMLRCNRHGIGLRIHNK